MAALLETRPRPESRVVARPCPVRAPGRAHGWAERQAQGPRDYRTGRAGERPHERGAESEPKELGRRVLVVDDEPSIRLLCAINLKMEGYEVQEAENGAEAIALVGDGDFDLILLDVMLPDMGGFDVARALGRDGARSAPPVVFLSARADRDDLRSGYAAGGVDYITKPFDPTELAGRVKEIIDRAERGESEQYRRARLAELSE